MLPAFFTKNSQALYTLLLRINIPKSSEFSTMAQTKFMFFSLLVLVLVITLPLSCVKAQQASNVFSSYHLYNPDQIGWDSYAVAAYCSTYYGDMPLEWRQKYGWTAFCGPSGPSIDSACGQCLKVTNTDTGDEVIVRIIDQCNNGGMDLDVAMFNQIDSNGQGYAQGHLIVDYEFVDCGDS